MEMGDFLEFVANLLFTSTIIVILIVLALALIALLNG